MLLSIQKSFVNNIRYRTRVFLRGQYFSYPYEKKKYAGSFPTKQKQFLKLTDFFIHKFFITYYFAIAAYKKMVFVAIFSFVFPFWFLLAKDFKLRKGSKV